MNALLIVIAAIAVALFIIGGLGESLQLLWVIASVLLVVTLVVFLSRIIAGRRDT
ncbi:hypothetical protein ACFSBZ_08885 [Amnibacterium flavum]|uniref:hypothetical protein n=1 Tax=Amnibacterium flavum TaxID=2173173 RepID=UPI0014022AA8|nr:hypothetical protein [Amnibacterium flavum]